jgi:N-methylhydantoinase B
VEVKTLLDSLIAGAMGQAVPEKMVGDLKGSGNHISIAPTGEGQRDRLFYLFYEYPAGGTAATSRGDGSHATRTYTEGDFNSIGSAEVIESEMQLRVERTVMRTDSHGHGRFRGGCGITRDIRVLEPTAILSVLSDRNMIPPYGVAGAPAGQGNRFVVIRNGEQVESSPIPGKIAAFPLLRGDIVRMQTAGGGGWGDPLLRDAVSVAGDVAQGFTSREVARDCYGVVLDDASAVDEWATAQRRREISESRVMLRIAGADEDVYDGTRRVFALSADAAKRLGVCGGELCELANPGGPSLRGWVRLDAAIAADALWLGPFARAVLRCEEGSHFELRKIG